MPNLIRLTAIHNELMNLRKESDGHYLSNFPCLTGMYIGSIITEYTWLHIFFRQSTYRQ